MQLADAVAPHLASLLARIGRGEFLQQPYSDELIRDFHREIIGDLIQEIAGQWRREPVQIGNHVPPEHFLVPMLMRDYAENVQARLAYADSLEFQLELLAYAEGEFLHIHPFADFNGRTIRALLSELLVRIDWPFLEVAVERGTPAFNQYRAALADYDNGQPDLLVEFWTRRLES
ncbi:Fic family protein [Microbacterium luticocti]|uniref:Fic family protein n=1 Tax=Microbacterium luticocti TaxID=451764 RepID=UPI001469ACE9|nr:Fic family protein [Microbacterium luticocti]